jgi:hypothetical protein
MGESSQPLNNASASHQATGTALAERKHPLSEPEFDEVADAAAVLWRHEPVND